MVITCEQCTTRFQLDDSRVPEKGVRVRCSKCQHAFFVKPSPESGGDPVESVVSDTLSQNSAVDAQSAASVGETQELPEPDWEFNHDDDGGHHAAMDEAEDMVDDLLDGDSTADAESAAKAALFGTSESVEISSDVEDEIAALLGDTSESIEIDDERSVSSPDLEAAVVAVSEPRDDAPALIDEAELPAIRDDSGLALADDVDEDMDDAPSDLPEPADGPEFSVDAGDAPESEPTSGAASLPDEELGSPDEWDFFADLVDADDAADAVAAEAPPVADAPTGTALAQIQVGPPGSFDSAPVYDELPELEAAPSALAATAGRVGAAAGWLATLALIGFALVSGLEPRAVPIAPNESVHALDAVRAHRIDNRIAGPIVLVEGTLRSGDIATGGSGKRFAVQLLDANGGVLVEDAASFGPARSHEQVREMPPAAMRETWASEAVAAAWGPVANSPERKLHAVLAEIPAAATHLQVVHVPVDPPPVPTDAALLPVTTGELRLAEPVRAAKDSETSS